MTEAELEELVTAWIALVDSENEFTEESQFEWARDALFNVEKHGPSLWQFILAVHLRPLSEKVQGRLAAGPLENLIARYGTNFIDRIEQLAEADTRFKELLGGVWQLNDDTEEGDKIWERIEAARGEAWGP